MPHRVPPGGKAAVGERARDIGDMLEKAALGDEDRDQQDLDGCTREAAAAQLRDRQAECGGAADQQDHGDDPADAARGVAANLAVELAVEIGDGAAGECHRMRHPGEYRRHVAKPRVDREAGGEQQQRVGDARDHGGGSLGRGPGEGQPMTETAVLLCGHGSRDPEAIAEFELLAAALRPRLPRVDFATGYLEFARPTIRDGLAALAARGARRILAVPGMLFAASHVKNDLPWEVNSFAADNPRIEVRLGRDLAIDPKLLRAAADRIAAATPENGVDRAETLLVVVGRGTNDPDANSNIAKVTRMLWEGMGFGWAETAFSGVAHPRVDAALTRAARLGFRRIVVFPYFLFTGVLVKRIYAADRRGRARAFPRSNSSRRPYLRDHPAVLDAFCERVAELADGQPAMNCQLCKYRTQIIGYEDDAGAPQAGHHHHVRGDRRRRPRTVTHRSSRTPIAVAG